MSAKKSSPVWSMTREAFIELLEKTKGQGFGAVFRRLGYTTGGAKYDTLTKRILLEGLNPEDYKGRKGGYCKASVLSDADVFVKNSSYQRHSLKARIIKHGYISYVCKSCGLGDMWNGKPITLQLEHINGVSNDNRLENLCFLCPNCHTQTATWGTRNKERCVKVYHCAAPNCSNEISSGGYYCRECFLKKERKVADRPSYEQLLQDIEQTNYVQTGKKYGVSDNTVRKWIRAYEKIIRSY